MLVKLACEEGEKTQNAILGLAGLLWGLGRLDEDVKLGAPSSKQGHESMGQTMNGREAR